jgi:hypothetical protein
MADHLLAPYGISREEEQRRWQAHRLEQLIFWANMSFEEKVQMLEEMEKTAIAFGNEFDPVTGRLGKKRNKTAPSAPPSNCD